MLLPQRNERYTYADYCMWDDSQRWELIDGIPYSMSPAPAPRHQYICGQLIRRIGNFLDGKSCKVYPAPFDVRLAADGEDDTVVQPDISVVCDRSKIDERGCSGAPDWVIEVLSPSTASKDTVKKMALYQRVGVREYWIVDPERNTVHVYILKDGLYFSKGYCETDRVPVVVLDGLEINLPDIFTE